MSDQTPLAPKPGTHQETPDTRHAPEDRPQSLIGVHKLHKSYLLFSMFSVVTASFAAIVVGLIGVIPAILDSPSEGVGGILIIVGVIVGLVVLLVGIGLLSGYLTLRTFRWELSENEFHIRSGIIFKQDKHIPLTRVNSVDHTATIVERILGLVTLKIITAGGTEKGGEARIPAIRLWEAEQLNHEVFLLKQKLAGVDASQVTAGGATGDATVGASASNATVGTAAGSAAVGQTAPVSPTSQGATATKTDVAHDIAQLSSEVRGVFGGAAGQWGAVQFEKKLTLKDIFFAGISDSNAIYFMLAIVGSVVGILADAGVFGQVFSYLSGIGVVLIVILAFVSLFVGWVTAVIRAMFSFGGFTVRKKDGRIEVERGLTKRTFLGIATDRVQSVCVSQGPIRRLIGYGQISVDTVAGVTTEGQEQKTAIVHPFIKMSEVEEFMGNLLPEFASHPQPTTRLPKRARRRYIFRSTFWVALVIVPIAIAFVALLRGTADWSVWPTAATTIVILAICVFIGVRLYLSRGFGMNDEMIAIQKGLLKTKTVYISRKKVQWSRLSQNVFQKRVDLASLKLTTAAGGRGHGTATTLSNMEERDVESVLAWAWPPVSGE